MAIAGNSLTRCRCQTLERTATVVIVALAVALPGCATKSEPVQKSEPGKKAKSSAAQQADANNPSPPTKADRQPPLVAEERGAKLYAQHCAACHGDKGDGNGLAAKFLFPKPRDFRTGNFRLVSTDNRVPALADLETVIARGMPGSSMPPWLHLLPEDRRLLAEEVFKLRREGAKDVELAMAAEADVELSTEELETAMVQATTAGQPIEVPPLGQPAAGANERGKELYLTKGCASCHGKEGRGDGQERMVDVEGLPTRPRDLTLGLFKGSPDFESVYRRILSGMPGTPMPALQGFASEQVADLTHFVLSMSSDEVRQATVPKREWLIARKVNAIAAAPESETWQTVEPTRLRTIPLWWRDDPDPWVEVQAVHDGQALALRLSWRDTTPDRAATRSEAFKDAAAVELYRGPSEPFVGMGALTAPVDVWMWDADRDGRPTDVDDANPNLTVDIYPFTEAKVETAEYRRPGTKTADQAELALPAKAVGNPIVPYGDRSGGTALVVGGPGSVTFRLPTSQYVEAQGQWHEGRWTVVLIRPLKLAAGQDGVSLAPGDRLSAAFAVWDGSHHDRNGQKLITIWQDLELEALKQR